MVGKELPGTIERIDGKAYEFYTTESGERVELDYYCE
jgi:hypothetical protein